MTRPQAPARRITILDCTLRDGSYLVGQGFTAEDTFVVAMGLAQAGFERIEIGPGTGLCGSGGEGCVAVASDEEHLEAAKAALAGTQARFGMFLIPGIGTLEALRRAAALGMGFVRVGTNVTEVKQARPFIELAKELGLEVSANLMKSYALPPDEFVRAALRAAGHGADVLCLVDSAGGMFPGEVRTYVERLRAATDTAIGFHGHNNLHLAMANSLEAVHAGADVVDATLQCMGRSAGNAQTEILAMALERLGYKTGLDPFRVLDLGTRLIRPMLSQPQGVDDLGIVSGIAQFHSGFEQAVQRAASRHGIDPRRLIMALSQRELVHVTEGLLEEMGTSIRLREASGDSRDGLVRGAGGLAPSQRPGPQAPPALVQLQSQARKSGKTSVLAATLSPLGIRSFPYVRQSEALVISNVEAASLDDLEAMLAECSGWADWILFDGSYPELAKAKERLAAQARNSRTGWYSERRALFLSMATLIDQDPIHGSVLVLAQGDTSQEFASFLRLAGSRLPALAVRDKAQWAGLDIDSTLPGVGAVVAFDATTAALLRPEHARALPAGTHLYCSRPGVFPDAFRNAASQRDIAMFRVDSRVGLAVELELVIKTRQLLLDRGASSLAGVPVVCGGYIGAKGSVVLDSLREPTKVLGVADGNGGLLSDPHHHEQLHRVKAAIVDNLFRWRRA